MLLSNAVVHRYCSQAAATLAVGSRRSASASILGRNRNAIFVTSKRTFADIEVEHGRGQWKTYGDVDSYKQGKYQIKTFNKISPIGLGRFPTDQYDIRTDGTEAANAHAILLRSHKLQEEEVPKTVRAIARYVCCK